MGDENQNERWLLVGLLLLGRRHSAAKLARLQTDGFLDEFVEVQIGSGAVSGMATFLGVLWLGRCFGFVALFRAICGGKIY